GVGAVADQRADARVHIREERGEDRADRGGQRERRAVGQGGVEGEVAVLVDERAGVGGPVEGDGEPQAHPRGGAVVRQAGDVGGEPHVRPEGRSHVGELVRGGERRDIAEGPGHGHVHRADGRLAGGGGGDLGVGNDREGGRGRAAE